MVSRSLNLKTNTKYIKILTKKRLSASIRSSGRCCQPPGNKIPFLEVHVTVCMGDSSASWMGYVSGSEAEEVGRDEDGEEEKSEPTGEVK
jgi:hypothetical protein